MDSNSWISRLAAAKRHYLNQRQQSSQSDRLDFDEYEVEEEPRPDFPCPNCYEDHDIISLCSHLEDEHPFESKVAERIVLMQTSDAKSMGKKGGWISALKKASPQNPKRILTLVGLEKAKKELKESIHKGVSFIRNA